MLVPTLALIVLAVLFLESARGDAEFHVHQMRTAVPSNRAFDEAVLVSITDGDGQAIKAERQKLRVAVDVSTSMVGRKLEIVKHALSLIAGPPRSSDDLQVIAFNDGRHADITRVESTSVRHFLDTFDSQTENVFAARRTLSSSSGEPLAPSSTHSGILKAMNLIERSMRNRNDYIKYESQRIFIISDGLDPDDKAEQWRIADAAERLLQVGVVTSVFAPSGQSDERMLLSIAKAGHGNFNVLEGTKQNIGAFLDLVSRPLVPFATEAVLWLAFSPAVQKSVRIFGQRYKNITGDVTNTGNSPATSSRFLSIGTLPHDFNKEIVIDLDLAPIVAATAYVNYEFSYRSPSGDRRINAGLVRVHPLPASDFLPKVPAPCADEGLQDMSEMSPYISGAEWEVHMGWNCGFGYTNISSHPKNVRGTGAYVADLRWCADRCRTQPDCVAFSYPSPGDGRCWLKSGANARKIKKLNINCGSRDPAWDYYTLVDRAATCPKASCLDIDAAGSNVFNDAGCPGTSPGGDGKSGNGRYICTASAHNGKNVYKFRDGLYSWEMRWERNPDWTANNLGVKSGNGGSPKWVLHGNGQARYFVPSLADTPPSTGWFARNEKNSDKLCAQGTIAVVEIGRHPDFFYETPGDCVSIGGTVGEGRGIGRIKLRECQEACQARASCAAFEFNNIEMCYIHVKPTDGGSGSFGNSCWVRARSTRVRQIAPRRRCANARFLSTRATTKELCADFATFTGKCGSFIQLARETRRRTVDNSPANSSQGGFGTEAARDGCSCVGLGEVCDEVAETDSDVYEILSAVGVDTAVQLRRDLERFAAEEEEMHAAEHGPSEEYSKRKLDLWRGKAAKLAAALGNRVQTLDVENHAFIDVEAFFLMRHYRQF